MLLLSTNNTGLHCVSYNDSGNVTGAWSSNYSGSATFRIVAPAGTYHLLQRLTLNPIYIVGGSYVGQKWERINDPIVFDSNGTQTVTVPIPPLESQRFFELRDAATVNMFAAARTTDSIDNISEPTPIVKQKTELTKEQILHMKDLMKSFDRNFLMPTNFTVKSNGKPHSAVNE